MQSEELKLALNQFATILLEEAKTDINPVLSGNAKTDTQRHLQLLVLLQELKSEPVIKLVSLVAGVGVTCTVLPPLHPADGGGHQIGRAHV